VVRAILAKDIFSNKSLSKLLRI